MSLFNSLPQVESCCFCISLKVGSIIIVILHLMFVIQAIGGCGAAYSEICYRGTMMQVLGWIAVVISVIILFTAVHFLIGIAKGWPDTAERFLYASALMLIFDVVASICICFQESYEDCSPPWVLGLGNLLGCLLSFYFLIVIASYQRVMMYR